MGARWSRLGRGGGQGEGVQREYQAEVYTQSDKNSTAVGPITYVMTRERVYGLCVFAGLTCRGGSPTLGVIGRYSAGPDGVFTLCVWERKREREREMKANDKSQWMRRERRGVIAAPAFPTASFWVSAVRSQTVTDQSSREPSWRIDLDQNSREPSWRMDLDQSRGEPSWRLDWDQSRSPAEGWIETRAGAQLKAGLRPEQPRAELTVGLRPEQPVVWGSPYPVRVWAAPPQGPVKRACGSDINRPRPFWIPWPSLHSSREGFIYGSIWLAILNLGDGVGGRDNDFIHTVTEFLNSTEMRFIGVTTGQHSTAKASIHTIPL